MHICDRQIYICYRYDWMGVVMSYLCLYPLHSHMRQHLRRQHLQPFQILHAEPLDDQLVNTRIRIDLNLLNPPNKDLGEGLR